MIAPDKALHFIGGVVLFAFGHFVSVWVAMGIVVAAALGKEIYDWFHQDRHTPEVADALYTVAGGLVGFLCWVRL